MKIITIIYLCYFIIITVLTLLPRRIRRCSYCRKIRYCLQIEYRIEGADLKGYFCKECEKKDIKDIFLKIKGVELKRE